MTLIAFNRALKLASEGITRVNVTRKSARKVHLAMHPDPTIHDWRVFTGYP